MPIAVGLVALVVIPMVALLAYGIRRRSKAQAASSAKQLPLEWDGDASTTTLATDELVTEAELSWDDDVHEATDQKPAPALSSLV